MRRSIFRYGSETIFTLLDQAFFSGSNFIANILLARWMTTPHYGIVALVLSLSLTVLLVYSNFLIEPMAVLGLTHYKISLKHYYRILLVLHLGLTGCFLLVCGMVAWLTTGEDSSFELWLLAGSTPFLLFIWLLRRVPYVEGNPRTAAGISALYAVTLITSTIAAQFFGLLTPLTAIILFSVSSVIPVVLFLPRICESSSDAFFEKKLAYSVIASHWSFSRWLVAAALLAIPAMSVQTVLTTYFLGIENVGILRAVGIFIMPASILATAIGNLAISLMARDYGNGDIATLLKKAQTVTIILTCVTILYCGSVFILGPSLDTILYAGKYREYMWLIGLLSLVPIVTALGTGWTWALRAGQQTRYVLIATAIGAALSLLFSLILIPKFGLMGVALSSLAAPLTYTIIVYRVGRKWVATVFDKGLSDTVAVGD